MKTSKLLAILSTAVIAVSGFSATVSAEWKNEDGKKIYITDEGKRASGYETIDGKTYYFTEDGYLKTGWITTSSGKKYYFTEKDGMKKGWLKMKNGKKYYMGADGTMTVGWKQIDGKTYYFNKDGSMKTGWLDTKGVAKYYLDSDGVLARNVTLKVNGFTYKIGSDGKAVRKNTSESAASTSDKKREFKAPKAGSSRSDAVKTSGIYDYYEYDDNTYAGKVMYNGKESTIALCFNERDELYSYGLTVPMSSYDYKNFLKDEKKNKNKGRKYVNENGQNIWIGSNINKGISYDSDTGKMSLVVIFNRCNY